MFDEILQMVKNHMGNNPEVASAIPADQQDAVHQEIASHINNGLQSQAGAQGGVGGLMSILSGSLGSGNILTSAITGGLVGKLASKFGLSDAATGAIAASIPGLLQKFAHKANDPNDQSITHESITQSLNQNSGGSGLLSGL